MNWRPIRVCFALLASLIVAPASAEVVADGRVGAAGPVYPGLDSGGVFADFLIDSDFGELAGGNWFHSFGTFSIGTGEIASFDGSPAVERIITGVTATDGAFINGRLRSAAAGVNLFEAHEQLAPLLQIPGADLPELQNLSLQLRAPNHLL